MASPLYRVHQFLRGFRTTLAPDEIALVRAHLTGAEQALFTAMEPRDRRHSVDLMHRLGAGASAELLAAALLHDVGKGRLCVWDRVAFVLLGALGRGVRERLEAQRGGHFSRALWRLEHHARLGAALLEGIGTHPRVVSLVARHTDAGAAGAGGAGRADGEDEGDGEDEADGELARLIVADGET